MLVQWTGTHFGWLGSLVHGLGRVPWLGASRSRLPNAGASEAQHSCLAAETGVLEPQWGGASLLALTIFREARFIAWHPRGSFLAEYRRNLRHFWNSWAYIRYGNAPGTHNKNYLMPNSRVRGAHDKYQWYAYTHIYAHTYLICYNNAKCP